MVLGACRAFDSKSKRSEHNERLRTHDESDTWHTGRTSSDADVDKNVDVKCSLWQHAVNQDGTATCISTWTTFWFGLKSKRSTLTIVESLGYSGRPLLPQTGQPKIGKRPIFNSLDFQADTANLLKAVEPG